MAIYTRYIALRILGPLLLIAFSMTALVWLAQSLRFLDFIVNRGLNTTMFLYLSSLLIPSLLGIVLPIALFISLIMVYNRLSIESELVVLKSAGMSRLDLMKPAMIVTGWVTLFSYLISLYLLPASYREFKDMQAFIRDNYISILLQEGVFNSPTKDLTVYIREINEDGTLRGMLMHDSRVREKPITMMAEQGRLVKTSMGPRFLLMNGNRQEIDQIDQEISLLYFDRYSLDLNSFSTKTQGRWREPEERYVKELFFPEPETDPRMLNKLKSEGHNRITWPLYNVLLAMLAMVAFMGGDFNRRGQWQKILIVSCAAMLVMGAAIALRNIVANNIKLYPVMYLFVLGGILLSLIGIFKNHRPKTNIKEGTA